MDDDDDDALYAHFPDEPLQLIAVVEESGTWKLEAVEQTLSLLAQITEPLVVVAVAGPYRSGKSSLMNWLAGSRKSLGASAETATAGLGSDKFAVGHGVRRCTRGLWVWGRPRRVTLKDGSNGAAIFIDSEGTGDLDADRTYDGSIFALATLLASTLLYNSVGSIDERTISDLGFIANASLKILAGSTEDIPMDDAMLAAAAQHTTDFVWVLRDFSLDLVAENGQAIDSDDYLNIALNQRRGDASDATRVAIATFFARKRKCITLPRPAASEEELNGGLAMTPRPEFLDKLKCLATVLFERCEAKKVKAVTLRGGTFAKLARSYAGVLGPKGPMDVQSAWEAVGAAELEDAVQRALNLHATSLESAFAAPLPQETENGASSESGPSSESSSGPTESTMSAAQLRACRAAKGRFGQAERSHGLALLRPPADGPAEISLGFAARHGLSRV
ncbi:guanylate-binding protein [Pelagophyceae sp. CCMP2097]|nr:guanylate-binding protein [Pelagophyceae sp. CCMP2097]